MDKIQEQYQAQYTNATDHDLAHGNREWIAMDCAVGSYNEARAGLMAFCKTKVDNPDWERIRFRIIQLKPATIITEEVQSTFINISTVLEEPLFEKQKG